jgi:carbon monoxide dehydrogenase subunit G
MASYSFVTEWRLEAPIERVFELLNDATAWPEWWPGVISIDEIRPPTDRNGVGRVLRSTFRGKLPFRLTFDMTVEEVVRPTSLAGRARGELDGVGRWTLSQEGSDTLVRYDWNIRTTRWWMNLLAPMAAGAFKSNHDYIMRNGMSGICRRLGVASGSCVWVAGSA